MGTRLPPSNHPAKPHIRRSKGAWCVRNTRGSLFYFPTLAIMRQRWGLTSPYCEHATTSDLSDRLYPDLPEARAL